MPVERQTSPEHEYPATRVFAITPSDQVDVPGSFTRAVRVGGTAGDVCVTGIDDDPLTKTIIPNVQIGETLPIAAKKIWATGTTATGITGFR